MSALPAAREAVLRRRGFVLEAATLTWNVVGVIVLAVIALGSGSVAVVGFGLDSLIEIGASLVVIWELSGTGAVRQRRALRIIAAAFGLLAVYLVAFSALALVTQQHPHDGPAGIVWTGVTAVVMFLLAAGKTVTGTELGNPVLLAEGRVTIVDGLLAVVVLIGLALDALLGWWWADPLAALVLVGYAVRESVHLLRS